MITGFVFRLADDKWKNDTQDRVLAEHGYWIGVLSKGSNRSISSAQTDSSSNHKRSATDAALKDDASEDNGSLFPDSDGEMTDSDKRAKNRANACQPSR